jgi:phosphoglycerate dehydrogenase-like enzyme
MKIVVPEFMLSALEEETCELVQACDVVTVDQEGTPSGDPAGAEVVMLPWGLPDAALPPLLELPSLRWLHTVSAGVDHALGHDLEARGVTVTNARGVFDVPIAETVVTYILMMTKRMPKFMAQQREHRWRWHRLREAQDLTVGLVGLGHIGKEIAQRCAALGMRVLATRRHPERGAEGVAAVYAPDELDTLLDASDVVVLAVPLTEATRELIDAAALRRMQSGAWLVNIARGAVVDEDALLRALREGWIAGAALDVFTQEPLPEDSPFWDLPNVILTPHNAWSTPHLKEREAALFLENLRRYLRGEALKNVVDLERGY